MRPRRFCSFLFANVPGPGVQVTGELERGPGAAAAQTKARAQVDIMRFYQTAHKVPSLIDRAV